MTERKLVPNIRFMNFDIEWNTVKLSRLLNVYDGVHQTPKYTKNGVPFVSVENIRNLKTNKYISKNDFDSQFKSSKPAYGDLLMTRIGDIGTVNIVKSDGDLAYYVSLALLKPKGELCKNFRSSYYLMYLIESPRVKKELWKRTLHIAFPKKINKNEISKITIYTSSDIREQQKIGDLFAKLDRLLDLQQQKLDQLELLKKALLQKLFPKQGTEIPELRFKGFEDEWKTNALQEISKIVGGGTPDTNKAEYWNGDINWYSPTEIGKKPFAYSSNKKISKIGLKKSSAKLLPANKTVLFTSRAGIGDMAILKTPAATNQGFQSLELKDNVYPYFVYSYGFEIKRKAKKLASGSTFLEISNKNMKRITLEFPNVKEQQKIGTFFAKIDRLIELENKKFSNLKLVKKSLLQNMFVE